VPECAKMSLSLYRCLLRAPSPFDQQLLSFDQNFTNVFSPRFGRRKPLCAYLMMGSIMSIAAGVLSEKAGSFVWETSGHFSIKLLIVCSYRWRRRSSEFDNGTCHHWKGWLRWVFQCSVYLYIRTFSH
jgi:hypothetical protein